MSHCKGRLPADARAKVAEILSIDRKTPREKLKSPGETVV